MAETGRPSPAEEAVIGSTNDCLGVQFAPSPEKHLTLS